MKRSLLIILFACIVQLVNAQIIFSEDFEGTGIPAGWTQQTVASDGGWKFGANTALQSNAFPIPAHTKLACTNDDACNCNKSDDRLISPLMNWSTYSALYLSVDVYSGSANDSSTIDVSIDGGITWTVLQRLSPFTKTWQNCLLDLSPYIGNSNVKISFHFCDRGLWAFGTAIDNLSINITPVADAQLTSIIPIPANFLNSCVTLLSPMNIGGTLRNMGQSPITSFTAKYSDGTNTYSTIFSSLNIPTIATYNFTMSVPFSPSTLGTHNIKEWVELPSDADHTNDSLNTNVYGVAFMPLHKLVFEEIDGTWCGWSPRGYVFMDSIQAAFPSTTEVVVAHDSDPMTNSYISNLWTEVGLLGQNGFPCFALDRIVGDDATNTFTRYHEHENDFGFADLNLSLTYDIATRQISATVNSTFAIDLTGDYRLNIVITEDSVFGTNSSWDQHNYYSYQSANLPLTGSGHNWQTEPSTILAANMHYDDVIRANVGGFMGQVGSLPATLLANQSYNYIFNYTLPAQYHANKISVHAFLFDATANHILNANSAPLSIAIGIKNLSANKIDMLLYPVPATDRLNVSFDLDHADDVIISVTDIQGKNLQSLSLDHLQAGKNYSIIDISSLPSGNYLLSISTNKTVSCKMFSK